MIKGVIKGTLIMFVFWHPAIKHRHQMQSRVSSVRCAEINQTNVPVSFMDINIPGNHSQIGQRIGVSGAHIEGKVQKSKFEGRGLIARVFLH